MLSVACCMHKQCAAFTVFIDRKTFWKIFSMWFKLHKIEIIAMQSSCRNNFCANRQSHLLPSTPTHFLQRVCTWFRLFSRYSSSHFPLCSFRIVRYDRWVFLPIPVTVHTDRFTRSWTRRVSALANRLADTEGDSRYCIFTESNQPYDFYSGIFVVSGHWRTPVVDQATDTGTSSNRAEIENLFNISGRCRRACFVLAVLTVCDRTGFR